MNNIYFSIIVVFKDNNFFLQKLLSTLNNQSFKNFELILVSENNFELIKDNFNYEIKFIKSATSIPPKKRDIGILNSDGNFIVFIDDDAYPRDDWLLNASKITEEEKILVFGGPGITPPDERVFSKILTQYNYSKFTGGIPIRNISIGNIIEVSEWPSMNFFCKKEILNQVNNFDNSYWPGDDSYLCEKISSKKFTIYYVPNIVVYHYRRQNFIKHFKQVYRYGLHRSYFFKLGFKNSRKLIYFVPSLILITILPLSILIIRFNLEFYIFFLIFFYYFLSSAILLFKTKSALSFISSFFVPLNILTYGFSFIKGLLTRSLNSKYER